MHTFLRQRMVRSEFWLARQTKNEGLDRNKQESQVIKNFTNGTWIYLGSDIKGGVLNHGSIYKNKLPNYIMDLINKSPFLADMFVEIEKAADFKKKVSEQGTEENRIYQNILRLEKEENK